MQLSIFQLPRHIDRERLAACGIAGALRRIFLSVSCREKRAALVATSLPGSPEPWRRRLRRVWKPATGRCFSAFVIIDLARRKRIDAGRLNRLHSSQERFTK